MGKAQGQRFEEGIVRAAHGTLGERRERENEQTRKRLEVTQVD
jgi:hypothetical protein